MLVRIKSKTPEIINIASVVSFKVEDNRLNIIFKDERLVSVHVFDTNELAKKALDNIYSDAKF